MNKKLTILLPLIMFTAFLFGQNSPIPSDSGSKESTTVPESFPKEEGKDPEQYGKEKIDWIKQNPEEYRRMGGDPDAINPQPLVTDPVPVDNSVPENGVYWKMMATDAKTSSSSVSSRSLAEAKKELKQDLLARNWIWVIGEDKILILSDKNSFVRYNESSETQLILKEKKNCDSCSVRVYTITEKTDSMLTISIPFDDNEAIICFLTFKRIAHP